MAFIRRRWDFWTIGIIHPLRVVFVVILLLVLPAIGIVRDVLLEPTDRNWGLLKYVPRLGWYWYVIALLMGILIFLEEMSVRANQLTLRAQRAKHIERYRQYRERNKTEYTQPPIVIIQGTPDPTNLFVTARERTAYRDTRGVLFERDAGEGSDTDFQAVTANFHNVILAKLKPGEAMDVSARIVFHPFDKEAPHYVTLERAAWLREPSGKVALRRNDTRDLVVATLENDHVYAIKQLDTSEGQKLTTRVELPDDSYNVHIRLTAELESRFIHREHLVLERTNGDGKTTIKLMLVWEWRSGRIGDFNQEAYDLLERALVFDRASIESPTPENEETGKQIQGEFTEWQDRVAEFLLKQWDEGHKLKFLPTDSRPKKEKPAWLVHMAQASKPELLSSEIMAKTKILSGFQVELGHEILKAFKQKPPTLINSNTNNA